MAVLQMQKISICALKKDRKSILEKLQSAGVLEVTQVLEEDSGLDRMDTTGQRQLFEKNAATADRALEVLETYVPREKSMLSGLEGKALKNSSDFSTVGKNSGTLMSDANQILGLSKQIAEDKAGIVKLENQIESLSPWFDLDIPMDESGTKRVAVLIGTISSAMTMEQIYQALAEKGPELEAVDIHVISSDKDQTCIAALCLREESQRLEEILRTEGFARPSQAIDETPSRQIVIWNEKIEDLKKDIEKSIHKLASYDASRDNLEMMSDYFRIRAQKYEVLGSLLQSKKTFVITGYVPERVVDKLEETLNASYDLVFSREEMEEDEEPPVLLQNGLFASSAEGVVESFGLPGKGEMDPTTIMSACYVFLFGLMLSDAAYGLIVFLACFIVLKKFPRMGESLKKSIRLFMYCGLSTLFWGVMFGGYFGDAVSVVARTFLGREVEIPALWFVPLNDPVRMLMFSLLFGVIHLFLGLGLKGYMCIRDKRYLDFFCDVVLWYALLLGLIFILLPTDLFASISQMTFDFPPFVGGLAKGLAIFGAVGILLMSGRSSKNPALRVALGAYDLYNLTGWLSDVLSYSRLLALGLATGVIASVVNQMGSMLGNGIVGIIGFTIIFIVGHLFNLAINLLGAYVHTCRLQYVEFFGKFYEGGGRLFVPFKQDTKYVDIKED